ncbi:MAG: hypothetical protein GY926_13745 [bacterium]|nr:hypothetical protein [bacterium]
MQGNLVDLERATYRASYLDGIIDLFVGGSLLWIGAIWVWAPDLGGLAGILPAVMSPMLVPVRKQIVEPRGGFVKWGESRRNWERRNLNAMVVIGIAILLLGIGTYAAVSAGPSTTDFLALISPGLIAFILAAMSIGIGFLIGHWRFFAYAAVLVVGGILTSAADASPGWPLLAAGLLVAGLGGVMLVRFIRSNPVVESP